MLGSTINCAELEGDSIKCEIFMDQNHDLNLLEKEHILSLTKKSFELYSKRLSAISNEVYDLGLFEFNNSNEFIVNEISKLNPISSSLSVTSDKSLHYTFRFINDYSAFFETYLDTEFGNQTFIEVFNNEGPIYSRQSSLDKGISFLKDKIKSNDCYSLMPSVNEVCV